MSDHDFRIAKQLAQDANALQDELKRLRAIVDAADAGRGFAQSEALKTLQEWYEREKSDNARLRAEVKRRGELLRRARLFLYWDVNGIPAEQKDPPTIHDGRLLISEIEALTDD